jgi:DNA-binding CsgD family transcriptional regulator
LAQRFVGRTSGPRPVRSYKRGIDVAHAVGAVGLAERGNEELAATGARRRNVFRTGVDELTPTQRRVAQMAAEGMSNKAIAQALFVTVKTVEVHLSGVYRKLDINSRAQLDEARLSGAKPGAKRSSLPDRPSPAARQPKRLGIGLGSPLMRTAAERGHSGHAASRVHEERPR